MIEIYATTTCARKSKNNPVTKWWATAEINGTTYAATAANRRASVRALASEVKALNITGVTLIATAVAKDERIEFFV